MNNAIIKKTHLQSIKYYGTLCIYNLVETRAWAQGCFMESNA